MKNLQVIEIKGVRVLTTRQLAECYGTGMGVINNNFSRNKKRYVIGKHYIPLEGKELKELKTSSQIEGMLKRTYRAFFWTEKGALLHAKSLNTDKAWEVYDYLVDFYFRMKEGKSNEDKGQQSVNEEIGIPVTGNSVSWMKGTVVDIPENQDAQRLIGEMRKYLVGMDAMLDTYSMYLKEEELKKVGYTVNLVAEKISRVGFDLMTFKPHIVEKFL